MAQNKAVTVLDEDSKIGRAGRIPCVFDFSDFKVVSTPNESQRTFVGFESGIALDSHFGHVCLQRPNFEHHYCTPTAIAGQSEDSRSSAL